MSYYHNLEIMVTLKSKVKVVFIQRSLKSVGPLKALYISSPGRPVHSDTNPASPGSILATQQLRTQTKGPATRNDFVNDIVDDARADAIFAMLKTIVDDGSSTISSTISLRVAGPLITHISTTVYSQGTHLYS